VSFGIFLPCPRQEILAVSVFKVGVAQTKVAKCLVKAITVPRARRRLTLWRDPALVVVPADCQVASLSGLWARDVHSCTSG
jgi:hypothetical protein